tara:strand:+ start:189 stop:458 length:270 start_codon:yes stop_codon:yes gene_type:complete
MVYKLPERHNSTSATTIAEMRSWIHRMQQNVEDQLSIMQEGDHNYDWLVNRLEQLKDWSKQYAQLEGKKLPKPRNRSNLHHWDNPDQNM